MRFRHRPGNPGGSHFGESVPGGINEYRPVSCPVVSFRRATGRSKWLLLLSTAQIFYPDENGRYVYINEIAWLIESKVDWLIGLFSIDWSLDWFIHWCFGRLIDWIVELSIDWWFSRWLIDWLIDWLILVLLQVTKGFLLFTRTPSRPLSELSCELERLTLVRQSG